jgi:lipopolysaccharide assembly outer membrane protein LptD (OstA)
MKTIDSDLMVPTEEEISEANQRLADQVSMQDMQKEIAKGQFQMQLAQIQAQVQQQKIQAQAAAQQGAQQTQMAIAEGKNQAMLEKSKQEGELALEQQARDQDANIIGQVLQPGQEEQPLA